MSEHDVATRSETTTPDTATSEADTHETEAHGTAHAPAHSEEAAAYVAFLREEFPDWDFQVGETEAWGGDSRDLWVARRDGHHPQSELTAAKLHTRLSAYLEREAGRHSHAN